MRGAQAAMDRMAGTRACGEAIEPLAHYYDDTNCQAGDCELWRGRQGFVVDSGVGVWIVMGYCSLWNRNLRASGRSDPAALPVCMLLLRFCFLLQTVDVGTVRLLSHQCQCRQAGSSLTPPCFWMMD